MESIFIWRLLHTDLSIGFFREQPMCIRYNPISILHMHKSLLFQIGKSNKQWPVQGRKVAYRLRDTMN